VVSEVRRERSNSTSVKAGRIAVSIAGMLGEKRAEVKGYFRDTLLISIRVFQGYFRDTLLISIPSRPGGVFQGHITYLNSVKAGRIAVAIGGMIGGRTADGS